MMKGSFYTNEYPNLFEKAGYKKEEIDEKLQNIFDEMFFNRHRFYFDSGEDMGYVVDTGNLDARSEGMSYAMMATLQMDRKDLFDRLWKWSFTYMLNRDGINKNFFAWSLGLDGKKNFTGAAPDGEEFFAMALIFASKKWGDGKAPFDYMTQARAILHACLHQEEEVPGGRGMWDLDNALIRFVTNVDFSDASYHLPHFYELFALHANEKDRPFWKRAAEESRKYIVRSCHPVTGFSPEYGNYDGSPYPGVHEDFYSDAYRVAGNIGLDAAWFGMRPEYTEIADKIQQFFKKEGMSLENLKKYRIDGTSTGDPALHPYGLMATNAQASLATDTSLSKEFVDFLWEMPVRKGERRYYDNFLHFFSFLAVSGRYKIWN